MSGDSIESSFHTDWGAIHQAPHSEDVLHDLIMRYLQRLQRHARIQWRNLPPEDVEDFVQSFMVKMLSGRIFAQADQSRGRFRTFFLRCFDNHVRDYLKRPANDEATLEEFQLPEQETNEIWALELFETASNSMRLDCERHGLTHIWEMAKDRFIDPILNGVEPLSYERLEQKYDLHSKAVTAGKIRTVKKRLELAVRATIATYVQEPDEIESELQNFILALPHQVRFEEPRVTTIDFLHSNWRYDLARYRAEERQLEWKKGSDELPTYLELFLADQPPMAALTAVRNMAKQWITNKNDEGAQECAATRLLPAAGAGRRLPWQVDHQLAWKGCGQTAEPSLPTG